MIDKVDKPELPSYRIRATAETHDRGSQKDQQERREEDEYSASASEKNWQKFHTEAKDRRSVKLRRKDIANLFFNQVVLQKGLVVIEVNLQLINDRLLKSCHLFSSKIDMYWKLKKLSPGQQIPVEQLISEEYVEVSVLHKGGTVRAEPRKVRPAKPVETQPVAKESSWSLWPLIDKKTGKTNWIAIILYSTIIIAIFISLIMVL